MKRIILMAAAYAAAHIHVQAGTSDEARAAISKAWQQYQSGVQSEQELIEVQSMQSGQTLPNKLLWRRIRYGEQGQRLSVKFIEPTADHGLGLLVERNFGGGDQVWLRQPSWTSARKVAGNREFKYFADTLFSFEDTKQLIGEQTSQFDYRYASAQVIVATPKPGAVSGYGRRDITLNVQGVPVRIDYFDPDGQPLKTLSFEELSYQAPGRWRADRIVLKHAREASQSTLKVRKRQFNTVIGERMFSLPFLMENDSAKVD